MMLILKKIGYAAAALTMVFALAPIDGASAGAVTYDYTGLNFIGGTDPFTTSENVTGTITLAAPLAANLTLNPSSTNSNVTVTAFSFSGGPETLTNAAFNAAQTYFQFTTDAAGQITAWDINIALGGGGQIDIDNYGVGFSGDIGDQALDSGTGHGVNHVAGDFEIAAAVPEPSTWAMMVLGFAGIGAMTYRRRKSAMLVA